MKVLISGGGTAGHINPAIAIAKRMQKEYHADILFVGKESGLEKTLVPKEGFDIKYIDVEGLVRKLTLKNIAVAAKYMRAISNAKKIIRAFAPDVVVGTGGYVCAPVLTAAHALKIPVLVHEQNVFPGMTVKMAARFADCVAISFEDTMRYVSEKAKKACVLTGNPLRENMLELSYEEARSALGIADDTPFVVTVGGSLGAKTINQALVEIMQLDKDTKFRLLGGTGERFYDEVLKQVDKTKLDETKSIVPYIYNMDQVLPAADLVIARSGAITVSELCALGRPAILIPSPNVTHNHQEYNAKSVQDRGAAVMICERDLAPGVVAQTVKDLLANPKKRAQMSENARKNAITDGTKRICDLVVKLANR